MWLGDPHDIVTIPPNIGANGSLTFYPSSRIHTFIVVENGEPNGNFILWGLDMPEKVSYLICSNPEGVYQCTVVASYHNKEKETKKI